MTDKSTQNSPKQYNISSLHPYIIEDKNGFMVYYEDYAILKEEVERVRMEQKLKAIPVEAKLIDRIAELKAEVEFWKSASTDNGIACNQRANENQGLENEIASLKADLAKSEEHNDALCERMSDLNSELFGASNINAKLHMKRVHDLNQMGGQCEEIARLKAEVERLTEAGNNLWAFAHNCVVLGVYPKTAQEKINIWNAAKDGKNSK